MKCRKRDKYITLKDGKSVNVQAYGIMPLTSCNMQSFYLDGASIGKVRDTIAEGDWTPDTLWTQRIHAGGMAVLRETIDVMFDETLNVEQVMELHRRIFAAGWTEYEIAHIRRRRVRHGDMGDYDL